ncbi:MAG: ABC transporter permease [Actinomycetota bacterium]|nr:ABC transporter permease [Actinomycetota bacterium]
MRGSAHDSFGGFFPVARAVAWRQVYRFFTNPAFLTPALFPLFFFVAFTGGLSGVEQVPGFDFSSGYTAFQFVWSLLQAVALGGAYTGFSIAGDFESGFARRLLLAASNRRGIVLGYVLASLVRATVTGTLVTVVALLTGMRVDGVVDLFGLVGLALLVNVAATLFGAGVAMLSRTQQAGPLIRTPIFLVLFLAPVFVPQDLLSGWIATISAVNPMTFFLEAGRGFVSGEPTGATFAFGIGAVMALILIPWALLGLRSAEKAG